MLDPWQDLEMHSIRSKFAGLLSSFPFFSFNRLTLDRLSDTLTSLAARLHYCFMRQARGRGSAARRTRKRRKRWR